MCVKFAQNGQALDMSIKKFKDKTFLKNLIENITIS